MSNTSRIIQNRVDRAIKQFSEANLGSLAVGETFFNPSRGLGYTTKQGGAITYTSLKEQYRVEGTINVKVQGPDGTMHELYRLSIPQLSSNPCILPPALEEGKRVFIYFNSGRPDLSIPVAFGEGIDRRTLTNRKDILPGLINEEDGIIY